MKKVFLPFAFAIPVFFSCNDALAQSCPMGIPSHGNPACIPPDIFFDTPGNSLPPDVPSPQWQTRWGAVAAGSGGFGASVNMPSKRKATKEALRSCKKSGGGDKCVVMVSYYNQCAAVAWGDGSYSASARAGRIELAQQLALKACGEQTSGCKVFYSECSYPARIR